MQQLEMSANTVHVTDLTLETVPAQHFLKAPDSAQPLAQMRSSMVADHSVFTVQCIKRDTLPKNQAQLTYGINTNTPFGYVFVALMNEFICACLLLDQPDCKQIANMLRQKWRTDSLVRSDEAVATYIQAMRLEDTQQPLSICLLGTAFQHRVWKTLLHIPYGHVASYRSVANILGKPTAYRAVANAIAHNPVAIFIPCHRVIYASGMLGGYRWGIERKRLMLSYESYIVGNLNNRKFHSESDDMSKS